jgi:protein-S-isoprenylcysteine O-methyltransferase Ste14
LYSFLYPEWLTILLAGTVGLRYFVQWLMTRRRQKGEPTDIWGTTFLFYAYAASMALAFFRIEYWNGQIRPEYVCSGFAVFAAAVALRFHSIWCLRDMFSYMIEVRENHRLVRTGPYAFVRHPIHLAYFFESLGIALVGGGSYVLAAPAAVLVAILVRNPVEEKALHEQLGDEWESYAREVPAMNLLDGAARHIKRRLEKKEATSRRPGRQPEEAPVGVGDE